MDGAENTIGRRTGDTAALPPLALPYPLFAVSGGPGTS